MNPATGQPYSVQLPDCRAYELVSSPNTEGWQVPAPHLVAGQGGPGAVVNSTGSVFYESQAVPPGTGALENGDYLRVFRSYRTPGGWLTRALQPTSTAGNEMLWGVASSGSRALVNTTISLVSEDVDNPTNNTSEAGQDLYLIEEGKPPVLVTHGEVPSAIESPTSGAPWEGNADLSAIAFISRTSLVQPPAQGDSTAGCYVWTDDAARLAVLTNPVAPSPNPGLNCDLLAVASDGRAIIEVGGRLYATDSAAGFPASAIPLSGETLGATTFDSTSTEGDTVYVTSADHLTPNAVADSGADVYAVNLAVAEPGPGVPRPPAVRCMSCEADGSPNFAGAEWAGQSEDGSAVAFTVAGSLYVRREESTTEIAPAADGVRAPVLSGDGRYVVVATNVALSATDVDGDQDLYLFGGQNGPVLVTSGETGGNYDGIAVSNDGQRVLYETGGESTRTINEWADGSVAQVSPYGAAHDYSVLGTAGEELNDIFLEAQEPLVPGDLNGGTTDIYDARIDGGFPAPSESGPSSTTPNPTAPAIPGYGANASNTETKLAQLPPDTSRRTSASASKPPTRPQLLARALKACKKLRRTQQRIACQKAAREKYIPKSRRAKKGRQK